MQLLNPSSQRGRAEAKLLFSLHFACLLSKYENVMQDPKVINRSVNLVQHLQKFGFSRQFKDKYVRDYGKNKLVGDNFGERFYLTVSSDRSEVIITRRASAPAAYHIEVSHA